jgi:hypothetical protein
MASEATKTAGVPDEKLICRMTEKHFGWTRAAKVRGVECFTAERWAKLTARQVRVRNEFTPAPIMPVWNNPAPTR